MNQSRRPFRIPYQILYRGVGKRNLVKKRSGYAAFENVINEALDTASIQIYCYCAMPNHSDFVLWPEHGGIWRRSCSN
jgi:hypothetical protein